MYKMYKNNFHTVNLTIQVLKIQEIEAKKESITTFYYRTLLIYRIWYTDQIDHHNFPLTQTKEDIGTFSHPCAYLEETGKGMRKRYKFHIDMLQAVERGKGNGGRAAGALAHYFLPEVFFSHT